MYLWYVFAAFCLFWGNIDGTERRKSRSLCREERKKSFYNFITKNLDGELVSMSDFRGRVVMAVNVATF